MSHINEYAARYTWDMTNYDPRLSEVGTLGEIAAGIGITDQALYNMRDKYPDTFPDPLRQISNVLVYMIAEVEAFHMDHGKGYGFKGRGAVLSGRKVKS